MNEQYAALITEVNRSFTLDEAQKLLDSGELREDVRGSLRSQGDGASSVLLLLIGKIEIFITLDGKDQVIGKVDAGKFLARLVGPARNPPERFDPDKRAVRGAGVDPYGFSRSSPSESFFIREVLGQSHAAPVEKEPTLDDVSIRLE